MQCSMIDQGGWIVFMVQMSWRTYSGNLPEKLFDIGEESKISTVWKCLVCNPRFELSSLLSRDCVHVNHIFFKELHVFVVTWLRNEGKIQIQLRVCQLPMPNSSGIKSDIVRLAIRTLQGCLPTDRWSRGKKTLGKKLTVFSYWTQLSRVKLMYLWLKNQDILLINVNNKKQRQHRAAIKLL